MSGPVVPGGAPDTDSPGCTACTRRTVLAGAGLAAVALATGCGSGRAQQGPVRVPVTDIPVGGGLILAAHRLVVTQPVAGTFHAFSAVCPHQGCSVSEISDGLIQCVCHGSRFGIDDGAPLHGPAREPLSRRTTTLADGQLVID
ncbi:Rieske (2Fe-2S) protein [Nocardia sp. NPDC005978]|uniref:Rieske (2Fe-2S) protein n=1 Tax=Nocardia sp. NPDC005978 TaxID=3156725 RepID=UPI0033AC6D14